MKSKHTYRLVFLTISMILCSISGYGQTFKTVFPTQLTMAAGQSDPINTLTIQFDTNTRGPMNWILPSTTGANGYLLVTDGNGRLRWQSPLTGISLRGDAVLDGDSVTLVKIRNVPIGTTTATAGNLFVANGNEWNSKSMGGDATIDTGGNITLANSATTRSHLGLGSLATQSASSVSITGGSITGTSISGSTGSFTDLSVSGSVTLPAGSVNLSSMSLTNNHIVVGNSSNRAAEVAMGGDASIINDGTVSVNAVRTAAGPSIASAINNSSSNAIYGDNISHDATLGVSAHNLGLNLGNANTWTGRQTFGAIVYAPAGNYALSAGTNDNIDVNAGSSNIRLTAGAGAATVTSINSPVGGRVIRIVNVDAANPITMINEASTGTAANRIHSANGNLILLPDGTATFMYDATINRWRYIDN